MDDTRYFINPLIVNISRNQIFFGLSILCLGAFTYITNRFLNNTIQTTNQYYVKSNNPSQKLDITQEDMPTPIPTHDLTLNIQLQNIHNQIHKNIHKNIHIYEYVFWNGDINSTYLLIDLLLQDKIIQPVYIEKYTILKTLENTNLSKMVKQYNVYKNNTTPDKKTTQHNDITKIKLYLEDIARIKNIQTTETDNLELLRTLIIKKYPEFQHNLLYTQYVTTITKDLEHTSIFFDTLKTISPIHYNGIEFIEQITRFIKHYKPFNTIQNINNTNITNITNNITKLSRILIGYSSNHKNINLIKTLLDTHSINTHKHIEMPLHTHTDNDINFLAHEICSNIILTKTIKKNKKKDYLT